MNTKLEKPIAVTVVLNFLIIVGAGHGIACLGMLEIFWFPYINSDYFTFRIGASYDKSLGASSLFSLIGQVLLICALFFIRNHGATRMLIFAGLSFLFIGFFYLTHGIFKRDTGALVGFVTGLPFLISALILLLKLRQEPDNA